MDDSGVEQYVNEHLDGYVMDLYNALEQAGPQATYADIGRPIVGNRTKIEQQGQDEILEKLKGRFLPEYPGRVMLRYYDVKYKGQLAKDLDPPALAFEVTRLYVPETGGTTPSGGSDVRVSLVH